MRLVRFCTLRKGVEVTSAVDRSYVVSHTWLIKSLRHVLFIQGWGFRLRKSVACAVFSLSYGPSLVIESVFTPSSHIF